MVGAMHSQGSTAGRVVMLQPPPNMVEYPGALRPFRVHNLDAAYNLAVKFWDGTFLIVLQPGEHVHLQFSANRDGTGFVIGDAPDRHHRASGASLGDFATRGYWLDENDDKYYLLQLPDWTFNSPDGFGPWEQYLHGDHGSPDGTRPMGTCSRGTPEESSSPAGWIGDTIFRPMSGRAVSRRGMKFSFGESAPR